MLESLHCHEWTVKGNSLEDQEREEGSCRESLSLLREYLSGCDRMLVEIWIVNVILMRSHMEMRNIGN